MAANYTREIVFKVNDRAIKQATDRLVQSLGKIEKKLDVIAAGFNKLDKDTKNIGTSINKWEKNFKRFAKPLVKAAKDVGKIKDNFELTEKL